RRARPSAACVNRAGVLRRGEPLGRSRPRLRPGSPPSHPPPPRFRRSPPASRSAPARRGRGPPSPVGAAGGGRPRGGAEDVVPGCSMLSDMYVHEYRLRGGHGGVPLRMLWITVGRSGDKWVGLWKTHPAPVTSPENAPRSASPR